MKNLGLLSIMFVGVIGTLSSVYGLVIENNYEKLMLFTMLVIIFGFTTITTMIINTFKVY
jgi:hypothetical protein